MNALINRLWGLSPGPKGLFRKSATSLPALNVSPAACHRTTRMLSSRAALSSRSAIAMYMLDVMEFFLAGRFSWMLKMAPERSVRMSVAAAMSLDEVGIAPSALLDAFRVRDACEIALPDREEAVVGSVQTSGVHRPGEISDEHPVVANVKGDADALAEVAQHDVLLRCRVDGRAVDGVAFRRVAAVRPIEHAMLLVDLEIDRLGQGVEKKRDVAARRGRLSGRHLDPRSKDPAQSGVLRPLLRPVEVPAHDVDDDADALFQHVGSRTRIAVTRVDERLDVGTVKARAHYAHAFPIAPVELAVLPIERHLLGREHAAFGDDELPVAAVEIRA